MLNISWWAYALMAAALWGIHYTLIEVVFSKYGLSAITTFAITIALSILLILFKGDFILKELLALDYGFNKLTFLLIILSASYLLAWLFTINAIESKNASLTAILEISYPIFVVVFSTIIFGTKPLNYIGYIGGALILTGTLLVLYSQQISAQS